MQEDSEVEKSKKGVIPRLFGVVLFSLGILNTMLTLKGGIEPDWFNYVLMGLGSAFLAVGVWLSGR